MSSEAKQLGAGVKDPVCGMTVNPSTAKHTYQSAGKDYFFCCAGCVQKFSADPDKYLNAKPSSGLVMLGAAPALKVKDPVCGMDVDPATTKHKSEHAGKVHSFCSAGCAEKFRANPDKYLNSASRISTPIAAPPATAVCLPDVSRGEGDEAGAVSEVRDGSRARDADGRNEDRVHVPDASRDRAAGTGGLSDLRHGA